MMLNLLPTLIRDSATLRFGIGISTVTIGLRFSSTAHCDCLALAHPDDRPNLVSARPFGDFHSPIAGHVVASRVQLEC